MMVWISVVELEIYAVFSRGYSHVESITVAICYFTAFTCFHHNIIWCLESVLGAVIGSFSRQKNPLILVHAI